MAVGTGVKRYANHGGQALGANRINKIGRRDFLIRSFWTPVVVTACLDAEAQQHSGNVPRRFFFTSQGKTGMMSEDGAELRYLDFDVSQQETWQPGAFFPDGHRVIFLSMEKRLDGPGKPFDEYYHKTPTHIWIYDLRDESLTEIADKERVAPFYTPQLLLKGGRMLVQVVKDKVAQTLNINLDGSDAHPFTRAGEGMPYGMSLSPDGLRIAYHIAGPQGYEIRTCDLEGRKRNLVAKRKGHLYFGPDWSPDGEWLIFQDCHFPNDPGHDWSDVCLSRPDGTEQRMLTKGQSLWFAATYGTPENHSGGSNVPTWTPDGRILISRRLPGSKVPWVYQVNQRDVDHFNRAFKPDSARGGTELCLIDPSDGSAERVTQSDPPVWDFRGSVSSDGLKILFCRAETGDVPSIWVVGANGKGSQLLTKGIGGRGADHPRWIPQRAH